MADELSQDQLGQWKGLKQQAIAGELWMDPAIAEQMRKNCENLIAELRDMKKKAENLRYLSGYGQLPSALAMKAKFEAKAVGGGPHDRRDNVATRLDEAIAIATEMRDTYQACAGKLQQTDEQTGQQLGHQGQGLH